MRRRTVRSLGVACAVLVLVAAGTGCAGKKPAESPAPGQEVTVVYGGSQWLGHYPAMIGIEKGYFKEQGMRAIFQGFYTSSGRMGAMAAGQLDVATTGVISALSLMASANESFYVVGTPDSYAKLEGIVAKSDINSIEELKGKKLAVTFSSSAHVMVYDVLAQHGLDPAKDVQLINMGINDMPSAFATGQIDAAAPWTPAFEKLLAMPGCHLLVNDEEFSLYKQYKVGPGPDVLVVSRTFADKNPELAKKFVAAYFKACEFLKDPANLQEAAQIISQYTGLDPQTQVESLKTITWYSGAEQQELMVNPGSFVQGVKMLAKFLVDHKLLDKEAPVEKYLRTDLLPAK